MSLAVLCAKAWECAMAAVAFSQVASPNEMAKGLAALGVPCPVALQMSLTMRYIPIISGEAKRMGAAYSARSGRIGGAAKISDWPKLAGSLMLRSLDRAASVYDAMRARGFEAKFPRGGFSGRARPPISLPPPLSRASAPYSDFFREGFFHDRDVFPFEFPATAAKYQRFPPSACGWKAGSPARCSARTARANQRSCYRWWGSRRYYRGARKYAGLKSQKKICAGYAPSRGWYSRTPTTSSFARRYSKTSPSAWKTSDFRAENRSKPRANGSKNFSISNLADRSPHGLSEGEKKRAAICGVAAMRPEIMLLDEPSAQLDPRGKRELAELLNSFPQTKIISTHDLDFARGVCKTAAVLDGGRLAARGEIGEILADAELLARCRLA